MSPDWSAKAEPVPYATMGDPQSLNLYAYVRNNPLRGVDPDGHDYLITDPTEMDNSDAETDSSESVADQQQNQQEEGQQQTENVSATEQAPASTNSSGHPIDKDAIANYIDQNAAKSSLHDCATYCRKAFEAGGVDTSGHPVDAKDWGPTLLKNGAAVVAQDGYTPQKADTAVFAGNNDHPFGHIAVYDG